MVILIILVLSSTSLSGRGVLRPGRTGFAPLPLVLFSIVSVISAHLIPGKFTGTLPIARASFLKRFAGTFPEHYKFLMTGAGCAKHVACGLTPKGRG
jgi:hypothetical protein